MLSKANKNTRPCFIANPNNPTGTYLNINEIKNVKGKPACIMFANNRLAY